MFLLLLVILQALLLLSWWHISESVVHPSLLHGENRCVKKDLLNFLVLPSCNKEEKLPLFSDTASPQVHAQSRNLLNVCKRSALELALCVKFTLLKRKLHFGGSFKSKLAWASEGFFLHVQ